MTNSTPQPRHTGLKRIFKAIHYSLNGVARAWKTQAAFRQEIGIFAGGAIVALLLEVSAAERALLILSLGMILVAELLNSAVEACVDRIGPEFHPLSGAAKDLASAAVLVTLLLAAITWAVILLSK